MSRTWNNAVHEEALKRRKRKKLERTQKKVEQVRTDMFDYENQTNEISTRTKFDN
jgi:hypothetical protein